MDIFLGALSGLLIGAGTVYIWLQSHLSEKRQRLAALEAQYASEQKSAEEKLSLLEQARNQLKQSFQALSSEALSKNNESFLNLAKSTLEKYQEGAKGDLDKRQEAINKTVEPVGIALKTFNERVEKIEERRTQTDASSSSNSNNSLSRKFSSVRHGQSRASTARTTSPWAVGRDATSPHSRDGRHDQPRRLY